MPAAETQPLTQEEEALVEELLAELRRCYNHRGGPATVTVTVSVGVKGTDLRGPYTLEEFRERWLEQ